MNLPLQSQPVIRNISTAAFTSAIKASSVKCRGCLTDCHATYIKCRQGWATCGVNLYSCIDDCKSKECS